MYVYVMNAKVTYSVLLVTVVTMAFVWTIAPYLKELGYQISGWAFKPAWLLGKSSDAHGRGWLNRVRFYNFRRSYAGEHRGVKW